VTVLDTSGYVVLAVVLLFTYLAIVARHAIPRAPRAFSVALTAPMLAGVVLMFLLAALVRKGSESLFGVGLQDYMTIFVWTENAWLSVLLYYAFWWYRHGRNEEAGQFDRIEKKLDDAALSDAEGRAERTGDRPMEETDREEGRLDERDKRRTS
jgi:hypothetical protein